MECTEFHLEVVHVGFCVITGIRNHVQRHVRNDSIDHIQDPLDTRLLHEINLGRKVHAPLWRYCTHAWIADRQTWFGPAPRALNGGCWIAKHGGLDFSRSALSVVAHSIHHDNRFRHNPSSTPVRGHYKISIPSCPCPTDTKYYYYE